MEGRGRNFRKIASTDRAYINAYTPDMALHTFTLYPVLYTLYNIIRISNGIDYTVSPLLTRIPNAFPVLSQSLHM